MEDILIGVTDRTVLIFIPDPASTDGSGKTGLTHADLTVSYVRAETDNDVVVTDVTSSLSTLTNLTDAHTDWGVKEVSSTLAPGLYRLDIADAVFASGAWQAVVYVMITTSAAAATPKGYRLISRNDLDGVRLGLTALPNAAADAAGGLPISDAGGLDLDAKLAVATSDLATPTNITAGTITTVTNLTNAPTAGDLTATMKASVNAEADTAIADAALATAANLSTVSTNVSTLLTRIPAALFSGITSLAQWLGLIAGKQVGDATARTELQATGAGSGTYDETTDSQEAVKDAGVSVDLTTFFSTDTGETYASAVAGSIVKEIADNAGGSALTEAGIADAVWDELQSGHVGAGTFGEIASEIADIPTTAEFNARTLAAADYFDPATDDVTLADGVAHGGTTASLRLGSSSGPGLHVTSSATSSTAVYFENLANLSNGLFIQSGSGDAISINSANAHGIEIMGLSGVFEMGLAAAIQAEVADALSAYDPPTNAEMVARTLAAASYATAAAQTTAQTAIDAVKAKTDNLPTDPADQSLLIGATNAIMGVLGTPTGADLATDIANVQTGVNATATAAALATVDTVVDAIKVITDALGATAAARLNLSANQIIPGTVDTVTNTHTPTTTEFQADDITEATADHFNGRIIIFTSGALAGQATSISDYVAVGGIGQFTVVALTEAPANNDTFIVL